MFTGLVEEVGTVRSVTPVGEGARVEIGASSVLDDVAMGASIAVNGCCLTVIDWGVDWWAADAVPETLERTNLGRLTAGDPVNLERPSGDPRRALRRGSATDHLRRVHGPRLPVGRRR